MQRIATKQHSSTLPLNLKMFISEESPFEKVNDLLNFVESVRNIFDSAELEPNSLLGPNKICASSPIGIFLRDFLGRWDCLSFENVCNLFEHMKDSFNSNSSKGNNNYGNMNNNYQAVSTRISTSSCKRDLCLGVRCSGEDARAGEANIHEMFDYDPNSLIMEHGDETALVKELLASKNSMNFVSPTTRLQSSMLSLAKLWNDHHSNGLATIGVEETVKIAQQKGDRATVTKALLLLQKILKKKNGEFNSSSLSFSKSTTELTAGSNSVDQEAMIRRCLELTVQDASLQEYSIEVATSLLQEMINKKEVTNRQAIMTGEIGGRSLEDKGVDSCKEVASVEGLWTFLLLIRYGQPNLLSSMVANLGATGSRMFLEAPVVTIKTAATQQQQQQNKDASNAASNLSLVEDAEAATEYIECASVDYWCRLGLPVMAELECRRLLLSKFQQFSTRSPSSSSEQLSLSMERKLLDPRGFLSRTVGVLFGVYCPLYCLPLLRDLRQQIADLSSFIEQLLKDFQHHSLEVFHHSKEPNELSLTLEVLSSIRHILRVVDQSEEISRQRVLRRLMSLFQKVSVWGDQINGCDETGLTSSYQTNLRTQVHFLLASLVSLLNHKGSFINNNVSKDCGHFENPSSRNDSVQMDYFHIAKYLHCHSTQDSMEANFDKKQLLQFAQSNTYPIIELFLLSLPK